MEWIIVIIGILVWGIAGAKEQVKKPPVPVKPYKRHVWFNGKAYSRGKCKATLKRAVGIYKW